MSTALRRMPLGPWAAFAAAGEDQRSLLHPEAADQSRERAACCLDPARRTVNQDSGHSPPNTAPACLPVARRVSDQQPSTERTRAHVLPPEHPDLLLGGACVGQGLVVKGRQEGLGPRLRLLRHTGSRKRPPELPYTQRCMLPSSLLASDSGEALCSCVRAARVDLRLAGWQLPSLPGPRHCGSECFCSACCSAPGLGHTLQQAASPQREAPAAAHPDPRPGPAACRPPSPFRPATSRHDQASSCCTSNSASLAPCVLNRLSGHLQGFGAKHAAHGCRSSSGAFPARSALPATTQLSTTAAWTECKRPPAPWLRARPRSGAAPPAAFKPDGRHPGAS